MIPREMAVTTVQLICPNLKCRNLLTVPEDIRGKMVKCQHCQTQFRVPESSKQSGPFKTLGT